MNTENKFINLKGLTHYNEKISEKLKSIQELAEGKTAVYCINPDEIENITFKNKTDLEIEATFVKDILGKTINVSEMKIGDIVYTKNTLDTDNHLVKYFDRWLLEIKADGTTGVFSIIDADNPKLEDYYNKSEIDTKLDSKTDKVTAAIANNFVSLTSDGNLADSGKSPNSYYSKEDSYNKTEVDQISAYFINNYVAKVSGKDLSTNDFTNDDKNKLNSIAYNAEQNVQSNWNETDVNSDSYIQNKPNVLNLDSNNNIIGGTGNTATSKVSLISGDQNTVAGERQLVTGFNINIGSSASNAIFGDNITVGTSAGNNIINGWNNTIGDYCYANLIEGGGNKLEGGTETARLYYNTILGADNTLNQVSKTVCAGTGNKLNLGSDYSFVSGFDSIISGSTCGIFGSNHVVTGAANLISGFNNTVNGDANSISGDHHIVATKGNGNLISGWYNNINNSQGSLVTGGFNTINTGFNQCVIAGTNNIVTRDKQVIFGQYNKEDSDAALIIGDGTDSNRHNLYSFNTDRVYFNNNYVKHTSLKKLESLFTDSSAPDYSNQIILGANKVISLPWTSIDSTVSNSWAQLDSSQYKVGKAITIENSSRYNHNSEFWIFGCGTNANTVDGVTFAAEFYDSNNSLNKYVSTSIAQNYIETDCSLNNLTYNTKSYNKQQGWRVATGYNSDNVSHSYTSNHFERLFEQTESGSSTTVYSVESSVALAPQSWVNEGVLSDIIPPIPYDYYELTDSAGYHSTYLYYPHKAGSFHISVTEDLPYLHCCTYHRSDVADTLPLLSLDVNFLASFKDKITEVDFAKIIQTIYNANASVTKTDHIILSGGWVHILYNKQTAIIKGTDNNYKLKSLLFDGTNSAYVVDDNTIYTKSGSSWVIQDSSTTTYSSIISGGSLDESVFSINDLNTQIQF